MNKILTKFRLFLLSVVLVGSSIFPMPVSACEQNETFSDSIVQLTDPKEIENAIELLGLTEEEAEKVTLYQTTDTDVLERGVTQMPTFSMYTYNRGRDRIFNGNKVMVSVVVQGDPAANLHFIFRSYQDVLLYPDINIGDDGNGVFKSSWLDIRYGGTYYCIYEATGGSGALDVTTIFAVY